MKNFEHVHTTEWCQEFQLNLNLEKALFHFMFDLL